MLKNLHMMTRPLFLIALLGLAACTAVSAPPGRPDNLAQGSVPNFCKTAYEAGPSYVQADISARIAERKAAQPDDAPIAFLTALNRTGPHYPNCALSYGVEGHCDMVFDVLADGTTANILPVCSSRLFESVAAYAVSRWTFEPPGDGPRLAVLNRLTFKLDDTVAAHAPPELPAAEPGPVTR